MTDREHGPDADVGRRFEALRQEDRGRAPSFGATLDRAYARHSGTPGHRRIALAAAALIVGVALTLFVERTRSPRPAIDLATMHLRTPTDFLLRLPGADLLRTVPHLGGLSFPDAQFLTTPIDRRNP